MDIEKLVGGLSIRIARLEEEYLTILTITKGLLDGEVDPSHLTISLEPPQWAYNPPKEPDADLPANVSPITPVGSAEEGKPEESS